MISYKRAFIILIGILIVGSCSATLGANSRNDQSKAEFSASDTVKASSTPERNESASKNLNTKPPVEKPGFDGDGTYLVNDEITPGTYTSGGENCYWARLKNTDGGMESIIVNHFAPGRTTVTISDSDTAFETRLCNRWVKVGK